MCLHKPRPRGLGRQKCQKDTNKMPLTPLNNDFLQCPICFNCFTLERRPVTLLCSHTCCSSCLTTLQNCPFDQTEINSKLPENEAILSLLPGLAKEAAQQNLTISECMTNAATNNHAKLITIFGLSEDDALNHYRKSVECIKCLAQLLKSQSSAGCVLSRPMQRKLVTLLHCQLVEGDGRLRAIKNARSIGERALSELLIKHQDPYTLSANLWAAVRSRGCQFLGPAMQEEILKLVLLALEEGSHLSRKVLVMFVVQRLSPHFPHQASKTAIGHVIQLLYRASCFRLTKREGDSSLMQLKEEYCSYEALRREHDTQIVSIALESGLKISPDQWSSLLYGDTSHKSHMQSIIDKLQSPASFNQSIQELVIALQRTQDPAGLSSMKEHFERLAKIDPNAMGDETDPPSYPTHEELATILDSCKLVTLRLIEFCKQYSTSCIPGVRYTNSRSANYAQNQKFKGNRAPLANGNKANFVSNGHRPSTVNGNNEKPVARVNGSFESMSPSLPVPPSTPIGQFCALDTNATMHKLRAELMQKPCAHVSPSVQHQPSIQSHLKSNHFTLNQTNGTTNGNGYTNGISKVHLHPLNNNSNQTSPKHQVNNFQKPVVHSKPANGNAVPSQNSKFNALINSNFNRSLPTVQTTTQPALNPPAVQSSIATKSPQQQQVRNAIVSRVQPQQQTLRDQQANLQNLQNGLNALTSIGNLNALSALSTLSNLNLNNTNALNSLSSLVNLTNANSISQLQITQTSNSLTNGSSHSTSMPIPIATKQLYEQIKSLHPGSRIGSFEDDQFIPFADQPFVSKFGPISRAMNALDTATITGCTAKASNGLENGNCDGQMQLTNVVLNRSGLPSLTLIEPMQQMSIQSPVFADFSFL